MSQTAKASPMRSLLCRVSPATVAHTSSRSLTTTTSTTSISTSSSSVARVQDGSGRRGYSAHPRPTSTKDIGKRTTVLDLGEKYRKNIPLTMLTAKDFPSAVIIQQVGGIDLILVGDSLGMTTMGYESTIPVTMTDMLHHAKCVHRGNQTSFLVGDMPFGSYEPSSALAVENAMRLIKEANMNAIKLEGGKRMAARAKAIVEAGIPVMGHIGLTPQSIHSLGGFKVQGRTSGQATAILEDALALQDAGVFAMVLECIPDRVATFITQQLRVPTIGIGSGNGCSGQVLVWDDMVGQSDIQSFQPKFLKKYANVGEEMRKAVEDYRNDVVARKYPEDGTHTFAIKDDEFDAFTKKAQAQHQTSAEPLTTQ